MAAFLLIGPSGVGKTTAADSVSKMEEQVSVYDLDDEIKVRNGGKPASELLPQIGDKCFFELSQKLIEEISGNESRKVLIVVGAGSINYEAAHEWYLQQNLISLTGDPHVIYERGGRDKVPGRTIDEYIKSEYNELRQNLYKKSKYHINVANMAQEKVAESILEIVNR